MEAACCELGMHEQMGLQKLLSSHADVLQGLIKLLPYFSNTAWFVFLSLSAVANDTNGNCSAA